MSDDPVPGCGISRIWETSPQDPFFKACKIHDEDYESGSPAQQVSTRKEVDDEFLSQMLRAAGTSFLLQSRAYLYYATVRVLGWRWWEGAL